MAPKRAQHIRGDAAGAVKAGFVGHEESDSHGRNLKLKCRQHQRDVRKRNQQKPKSNTQKPEQAPLAHQPDSTPSNQQASKPGQERRTSAPTWMTVLNTWMQVALVITTAIYVALTYNVWQAMLASNQATREMFERAERARIVFAGETPEKPEFVVGKRITAEVRFVNRGKSVAHIRRSQTRMMISDVFEPAEGWFKNLKVERPGVSDIGADVIFILDASFPELTPAYAEAINSGRARVFTLAHVEYDDGFGRVRTTTVCMVHSVRTNGWQSCETNNDSN